MTRGHYLPPDAYNPVVDLYAELVETMSRDGYGWRAALDQPEPQLVIRYLLELVLPAREDRGILDRPRDAAEVVRLLVPQSAR